MPKGEIYEHFYNNFKAGFSSITKWLGYNLIHDKLIKDIEGLIGVKSVEKI